MTVITVPTVGFEEVVSLTPPAELFTVVLTVAGVGGASYSAFSAVEVVVGGYPRAGRVRQQRRRQRPHRPQVLAVQHAQGGWLDTHPEPDSLLQAGDVLVVMGGDDDLHAMRERFVER